MSGRQDIQYNESTACLYTVHRPSGGPLNKVYHKTSSDVEMCLWLSYHFTKMHQDFRQWLHDVTSTILFQIVQCTIDYITQSRISWSMSSFPSCPPSKKKKCLFEENEALGSFKKVWHCGKNYSRNMKQI